MESQKNKAIDIEVDRQWWIVNKSNNVFYGATSIEK